jgi:hypothetical protein
LDAQIDRYLPVLLAINGLRMSEALAAGIDDLCLEHGHRTRTVPRKGGKLVTPRWPSANAPL